MMTIIRSAIKLGLQEANYFREQLKYKDCVR